MMSPLVSKGQLSRKTLDQIFSSIKILFTNVLIPCFHLGNPTGLTDGVRNLN